MVGPEISLTSGQDGGRAQQHNPQCTNNDNTSMAPTSPTAASAAAAPRPRSQSEDKLSTDSNKSTDSQENTPSTSDDERTPPRRRGRQRRAPTQVTVVIKLLTMVILWYDESQFNYESPFVGAVV